MRNYFEGMGKMFGFKNEEKSPPQENEPQYSPKKLLGLTNVYRLEFTYLSGGMTQIQERDQNILLDKIYNQIKELNPGIQDAGEIALYLIDIGAEDTTSKSIVQKFIESGKLKPLPYKKS